MSSSSESSTTGRKRKIAAVFARRRVLAAAFVSMEEESIEPTLMRRRTTTRKDWQGHLLEEGGRVFRKMYRMDVYYFNDLLRRIRKYIETKDVEMAVRSCGTPVCAEIRLAMTLRYLAGGQVWDIRSNFGVSVSEFYRSIWTVVDAINNEFPIDLDLSDTERLKGLEAGFARKSRHNVIRGAIGAIDGCLVWQKNPGIQVDNPNRYYCARKEKFAILLMAIADSDRRIIWFDMSCTPSTHDSLAMLTTELGQRIERGELPHPFLILGDSAFTCSLSLITPGKDDAFNFELSSLRINVECAFGELIRRWGILWRPLEMSFQKRTAVIGCCIRLHNYCIDSRIEIEAELMQEHGAVEVVPGVAVVPPLINKDGVPTDNLHAYCTCVNCRTQGRAKKKSDTRRRDELEQAVREMGLRRPYRIS